MNHCFKECMCGLFITIQAHLYFLYTFAIKYKHRFTGGFILKIFIIIETTKV